MPAYPTCDMAFMSKVADMPVEFAIQSFIRFLEAATCESVTDMQLRDCLAEIHSIVFKYRKIWERRKSGRTLKRLQSLERLLFCCVKASESKGVKPTLSKQVLYVVTTNPDAFRDINGMIRRTGDMKDKDVVGDRYSFINQMNNIADVAIQAIREETFFKNMQNLFTQWSYTNDEVSTLFMHLKAEMDREATLVEQNIGARDGDGDGDGIEQMEATHAEVDVSDSNGNGNEQMDTETAYGDGST